MNKFKVGDVVVLISGGPRMTISRCYEKNSTYRCQWFLNDELQSKILSEGSLKIFDLTDEEN